MDRIEHYRKQRQRIIDGLYNCIPLPFKRFSKFWPGTEKGKYIIVTANQKVGKSKFVDYVYVYEAILFVMQHPEVRLKIFYFSLEIDPKLKEDEFNSFLLNRLDGLEISPTQLNSVNADEVIDNDILDLLESSKYQQYRDVYKQIVTYISDIRNPTGITKFCRDYALNNGTINYTDNFFIDESGNKKYLMDKNNPYTPNDEEEYRIIIIDNASNFSLEKGLNKAETIDRMSKNIIQLRDTFGYTCVLIQHQAQAQEGIENRKMGLVKPSSDGLADCKTTSRDCNTLIGLYSPFKYGIPEYEGYNIKKFRNYIRFAEVLEDRDYGANGQICPLFFNGAVSVFKELPRADDPSIEEITEYVNSLNIRKTTAVKEAVLFIKDLITKLFK